jgi:hypothetical protein
MRARDLQPSSGSGWQKVARGGRGGAKFFDNMFALAPACWGE